MVIKWTDPAAKKLRKEITNSMVEAFTKEGMYQIGPRIQLEGRTEV